MKTIDRDPWMRARLLAASAILSTLVGADAADVVKANNTTSLVTGGSWVGGSVPVATDAAVFDDTYLSTANLATGGPLNWDSLRIEGLNANDRVSIPNTTYNNFIGLGAGGLDMSAAPRDLLIRGFVANEDQEWALASGRIFEVGGTRFGGSGNIDVTGDGRVIVGADNGSDFYSGILSVSGGTLEIRSLEGGEVLVNDGGILDCDVLLPGDLTLGSVEGGGLAVDPGSGSTLDVDALTLKGVNTVYLSRPPSGSGSIEVVNYYTINGGVANFALDPVVAENLRNEPTFSDAGGTILLDVVAGDTVTWTGAASGDWDVNTSANWDNGGVTTYFDLDEVIFDDSGADKVVSLVEDVAPAATSFTNTTGNDYTVGGTGGIGGGGPLAKAGTGTVTLANTNAFTGGTSIDGGLLVLDHSAGGSPLAATSDIAITAPATLRAIHDDGAFTLDRPISGDGVLRLNGHGAAGSEDGLLVTLSGDNSAFEGSIVFESPVTGYWRSDNTRPENLGAAIVTVESGAQLYTFGGLAYPNALTITGDGYLAPDGLLGAIRLQNNTRWTGEIRVTGTPGDSDGTDPDASIGLGATGTTTLNAYVDGPVSGGDLGLLGYSGSGNEWVNLTNANSYGDSIVRANDLSTGGQLALYLGGVANTTATLGTGDVHLLGGAAGKFAALRIQRDDGYSLPGDVLSGGEAFNTRLLVDTMGTGVNTNGKNVTVGEELRVSPNVGGSVFTVASGSAVSCETLNVGLGTRVGTVNITDGLLTVGAGGVIGNAASIVDLGGGTLAMSGNCDVAVPINISAASTLDLGGNSVQVLAGITGDGDLEVADDEGLGLLALLVDGDTSYDGDLSGSATLYKSGFGTLTLGGDSALTGEFIVEQGGLQVTGSLGASTLYVDGGVLHTGGSLAANLDMGAVDVAAIQYIGSPLAVTGNVTLRNTFGPIEVDVFSSGPLPAGTYPLITYSGTLTGDASMLSLPAGMDPGDFRQTFTFTAGDGSINLVVSGSPGSLVWIGPGVWDLNTTMPWGGGESFYQLDTVRFDDTATDGSVDLEGILAPLEVVVDNDTVPFIFGGTGSIDGGGTLVKDGPGMLTVGTINGFTGGTLIDGGGMLEVTEVDALGTGTVTVSDGILRATAKNALTNPLVLGDGNSGTADTVVEYTLSSGGALNMPTVVSGDAPDAKAIIRTVGTSATSQSATYFSGSILLENRDLYHENASESRIGGLSGKISGTGDLHITRTGNVRTRLLNNGNDFNGNVYVDGDAYLQIGTGGITGAVTSIPLGSDLIIAAGATAGATGDTVSTVGGLIGEGVFTTNVSASNTSILVVGNTGKDGVFDGSMTDQMSSRRLALTKVDGGTQVLNGECTFTGATLVEGGVLEINSPTYASAVTVSGDGTLGGTGMLASNLTLSAVTATVAPGAPTGTLTVGGNANLGAGVLAIGIDDGSDDGLGRLDVAGTLTLTDAALEVTVSGAAGQAVYVIASYGTLVGTFAFEDVPVGYTVDYQFGGLNQVALVGEGADDYGLWAGGYGLNPATDGAPDADPDKDMLTNDQEYAFGLSPVDGSSLNTVVVPLDAGTGTFTYTRRDPSLTGLVYSIDRSSNLQDWGIDASAVQNVISTDGDVQTVEVTLVTPLPGEVFVRVLAAPGS